MCWLSKNKTFPPKAKGNIGHLFIYNYNNWCSDVLFLFQSKSLSWLNLLQTQIAKGLEIGISWSASEFSENKKGTNSGCVVRINYTAP